MGSWNSGNFENDSTADLLADQKDIWIAAIEKALKYYRKTGVTPMEAEDEIMAYLEMIYRIAASRPQPRNAIEAVLAPSILPEPKLLAIWKTQIMTKHHEYFGGHARTSERFQVITATFDALINLADAANSGSNN